jgi:hypothetical protein
MPPNENEASALYTGRSPNAVIESSSREYHAPRCGQISFHVWQREAGRLFNEYWRTGNKRHLIAFNIHVCAMRDRSRELASATLLRE